jgi:hypothetical protein
MIRSGWPFRLGKVPHLEIVMPTCKECENEADTLVSIKVEGKAKKMCEDCADRVRETAEIAEASESVVQNMMGFKGRR